MYNSKNKKSQDQQKTIKAPFELNKFQVELVSGGVIGAIDDEFPHGLGCGCRKCRKPDDPTQQE